MTAIKDLGEGLHSYFAAKVPGGSGDSPGDVLLVFDALGLPLDPREFGLTGDGSPPADVYANQRAAHLADQLPAGNVLGAGSYLPRSNSQLSTWYQEALSSSVGTGTTDPERAAFEKRKATALDSLELNRMLDVAAPGVGGGVIGASDHHFATVMSPRGWFTPDSQAWTSYSQSSGDDPPPPPPPSAIPVPDFTLRVIDPDPPPDVERFIDNAHTLAARQLVGVDPPKVVNPEDFLTDDVAKLATADGVAKFDTTAVVGHAALDAARLGAAKFTDLAIDNPNPELLLPLTPAFTEGEITDLLAQPPVATDRVRMLTADDLLSVVAASTTQPVATESFSIHFEYTVVTFDRPWWNDVFVSIPGWQMPGFTRGMLASGKASAPASQFVTMVTTGMVVVRNLVINASWEGTDLAAAGSATSLGPFCIAGAEWNSQQLRRPGLQAIAWLCQVPPVLPPN